MSEIISKGRELYVALGSGDPDALKRLLSPTFQGELTAGLPHGFGRTYDGLGAMMTEGWGSVGNWFEMAPQVEEFFDGGSVLVGRGFYVGEAKPTGKPVRAAFAHFWRFRWPAVHRRLSSHRQRRLARRSGALSFFNLPDVGALRAWHGSAFARLNPAVP